MAKPLERERARILRKQGLSLNEIVGRVNASKSSISCWVRDISLTELQQQRLLERQKTSSGAGRIKAAQSLGRNRIERWASFHQEAIEEWDDRLIEPLFSVGLGLYLGDGDKGDNMVGLTNCDPKVIELAIKFLLCIGILRERMVFHILLSSATAKRQNEVEEFWREVTGLHFSQMHKTSVDKRSNSGKSTKPKWPNGVCSVRVCSTEIQQKLKQWMKMACEIE